MSYDGSGTYTPPSPEYPAVAGSLIKSADFNGIVTDIAAALSLALVRDGRAPMTGDLSLGTHKITNVVSGANPQDATTFLQVFTSPAFTGNPTAPTQTPLDNSTKLATTEYADLAVAVLAAVVAALDTVKAPLASPHFTGIPTAPTAATGTGDMQLATTAFVQQAAFNSALPSQVGQEGKFVQTNGVNASWQYTPASVYTYETAGGF